MKNKIVISLSLLLGLVLVSIPSFLKPKEYISEQAVVVNEESKIAKPGMIAYPAYTSQISSEPNYSSQNNYTFSCLSFSNTHTKYRGESVKLAIIDSGLNYTHEDFMSGGVSSINGNSKYYGYDYDNSQWVYYQYSSGWQTKLDDSLGHGTNVAACAAALINGAGGAGIAPNVDLYIYKVTNANNGYEFGAIQLALNDCISRGVKVINMSFQCYEHAVTYNNSTMSASSGCSTILSSYINSCYNNDIVLVAAAGNYNTSEPSYPASNNHVISVGSLAESSTTTKAAYSNTYGIDLVAPGTVYVADKGSSNAYKKTNGTSFSSPLVAGAIALYRQKYPSATASDVEQALYDSCDAISGNPSWAGHGRLNIDRFLNETGSDYPTEIVLNNVINDEITLEVDDTFDLDWTVNGVGTYSTKVEFSLYNDNGVVSVDQNGRITALKAGEEIVTITSSVDNNISADIFVTVNEKPTLTLSPFSASIEEGKTLQLTASTTPNMSISYSSSNISIATVSNTGLVTAVSAGNATITASSNGLQRTCQITVTAAPVLTSIEFTDLPQSVPYMSAFSLGSTKVIAHYDTGSSKDVTASSTIDSSAVNTSSLGYKNVTANYAEKGVNKQVTEQVKVTNNGASSNVGNTYVDYVDTNKSFTFSSKSWGDSTSSWTSGKAGNELQTQGLQVTSGTSGANATTKASYTNVSSVVVTYSTNASKGAGSVAIQIGSNASNSQSVTTSGGTSDRDLTYNISPNQTGTVKITVTCTANSIYIRSIKIYYQTAQNVNYPTTPETQAITWSNYFLDNIKPNCVMSGEGSDVSAIAEVWSELSNEYGYMVGDAKTAFASSNNATIVEARELYNLIVSKYGNQLNNNFVNGLYQPNESSMLDYSKNEFIITMVIISSIMLVAISFYFVKKIKMGEK